MPKWITHANERNEEREKKAETAKHNEIKKKKKRKGHRMQKGNIRKTSENRFAQNTEPKQIWKLPEKKRQHNY